MLGLKLIPVILSLLILAGHFMRHGQMVLVVLCLVWIGLLAVPRPWAARLVQGLLLVGAFEWMRTLVVLARDRLQLGEPFLRMSIILGAVVLLTVASALVFRMSGVRERYFRQR